MHLEECQTRRDFLQWCIENGKDPALQLALDKQVERIREIQESRTFILSTTTAGGPFLGRRIFEMITWKMVDRRIMLKESFTHIELILSEEQTAALLAEFDQADNSDDKQGILRAWFEKARERTTEQCPESDL